MSTPRKLAKAPNAAPPAHEETNPRRPYVSDEQLLALRMWAVEQVMAKDEHFCPDAPGTQAVVGAAVALESYVLNGSAPALARRGGSGGKD